jgi:hypothetical protein
MAASFFRDSLKISLDISEVDGKVQCSQKRNPNGERKMNSSKIIMAVGFMFVGLSMPHFLPLAIWFAASALWMAWGVYGDSLVVAK